ncbi:MAG: DUF2397 family protein, partial [Planctomycetes bacterium]|nr:DUF2397 family protein [Planctomycetota bacterium]
MIIFPNLGSSSRRAQSAIESFLSYKETLIEYLERFIGELVLATADIAETL